MLGALRSLVVLEVEGNPFCSLPHARAYIVHVVPTLQVLDGDAVTLEERAQARRRFLDAGAFEDAVRIVRPAPRLWTGAEKVLGPTWGSCLPR